MKRREITTHSPQTNKGEKSEKQQTEKEERKKNEACCLRVNYQKIILVAFCIHLPLFSFVVLFGMCLSLPSFLSSYLLCCLLSVILSTIPLTLKSARFPLQIYGSSLHICVCVSVSAPPYLTLALSVLCTMTAAAAAAGGAAAAAAAAGGTAAALVAGLIIGQWAITATATS